MNTSGSRDRYDRAMSVIPGGVNSPVRATRPYPRFIERGDGAHLIDVDGNRYIDVTMGYGPLLLGHGYPEEITAKIHSQVSQGAMYGAPTEVEIELAEFIARHVPSVEMTRFVNSGTEATVSAVRLARGVTDRDKIVIMDGGYHGAQESTLVESRPGRPGSPSAAGVPSAFAEHTITVPFNDEAALHDAFAAYGPDIAAVLVEPVLGNTGIIEPVEGYLETIRETTEEHGSLLIFDEVITGFRVGGLGCAQTKYDIEPDLTTFGKVIGGGFPVGAIGGQAEVMEAFTPTGDVFQAGTFSGHPVTMTAGLATLEYAAEENVHKHLSSLGKQLRSGLEEIVDDQAPSYSVVGTGSMFKVIFTRDGEKPRCGADVEAAQTDRWERLFRPAMLEEGVFLSGDQKESQFLSAAHTEADVEALLEAYKAAL